MLAILLWLRQSGIFDRSHKGLGEILTEMVENHVVMSPLCPLVVCALSLSLRHQKRDSHSPFEEDDVRENIISYDDEGGGEADTAAFDITALQSMHRIQHMHNNRNM